MNKTDALMSLVIAMISGDREGARTTAVDAVDQYVHDFIFPDEASDLGDDMGGFDDMSYDDVVGDPDPDLEHQELPGDAQDELEHDDEVFGESVDLDDLDDIEGSAVAVDDVSDEMGGDEAFGDTDVEMDALDADMDADLEADTVGEEGNLIDVAVDPEASDDTVSAIKMIYDNDTEKTFYTFTSDADEVVLAIKSLMANNSDVDAPTVMESIRESFTIL